MNTFRPLLVAIAATLVARFGHADAVELHRLDVRDVAQMSALARDRFNQGQTLMDQGDFEGARELFQQVTASEPHSAIALRQLCEALTSLGRRDEAIGMCIGAMHRQGSAMDFRSYVRALMSGDRPINPEDMSQAVVFARKARDTMPDWPWGYAAQCDIAHRLGDTEMLKECLKELERVAPDHPETRRVLTMAATRTKGPGSIVGWLAIALACVTTAVHALWRARQRSLSRAAAAALGSLLAGALTLSSSPAAAQDVPRPGAVLGTGDGGLRLPEPGHISAFDIDDGNPLEHLPPDEDLKKNPLQFGYLIMDLTDRAEAAVKRDDHAAAIKYWQALAKITPDRSVAFAKMCVSYEAQGALEKAIYTCAAAIERPGTTIKDYMRYVGLVLSKSGSLSSTDVDALDKVLAHLQTDPMGKGIVDELACRIGVRLWDARRLGPCTANLAAARPDHRDTVYFQWALAAAQGEEGEARRLIDRAKAVSVDANDILFMEQETSKLASRWKNHFGIGLGLLVMVASCAGLIYSSRRRPTKASKDATPSNVAV